MEQFGSGDWRVIIYFVVAVFNVFLRIRSELVNLPSQAKPEPEAEKPQTPPPEIKGFEMTEDEERELAELADED